MEIPQRWAVAEVEGWAGFCQRAKPRAGKVPLRKIPRMRMQSCPDHCEPDVCQLWAGGEHEDSQVCWDPGVGNYHKGKQLLRNQGWTSCICASLFNWGSQQCLKPIACVVTSKVHVLPSTPYHGAEGIRATWQIFSEQNYLKIQVRWSLRSLSTQSILCIWRVVCFHLKHIRIVL